MRPVNNLEYFKDPISGLKYRIDLVNRSFSTPLLTCHGSKVILKVKMELLHLKVLGMSL